MHQLNRHRTHDHVIAGREHGGQGCGCRGDGKCGTDPFAAGGDQVAGDLGEEGVIGDDRATQCLLHPHEVGLEHGELQEG